MTTSVKLGDLLRESREPIEVRAGESYENFGIYSFGRGAFSKQPISGTTSSATTIYRARARQIVYSRLFAFEGAYAIVTPDLDQYYVSNEFPLFTVDESRAIPEYVAAYLQQQSVWEDIATAAIGVGHRRQRVRPEALLAYEIPLPSLGEQRQVVSVITAIHQSAAEARSLRRAQESELLGALNALFHRCITNAPRKKMREVAPLVRRPINIDLEKQYPELGIKSFGKGTFHKPPLAGADVGTKRLFEIHDGDLLFSNVFAWEGAIAVATREDHGRYGSHRFITRRANEELGLPAFLCFYFLSPDGLQQIDAASPGGAGRNRTLGLEALDEIEVPLPSVVQQRNFLNLLNKAEETKGMWNDIDCDITMLERSVPAAAFKNKY